MLCVHKQPAPLRLVFAICFCALVVTAKPLSCPSVADFPSSSSGVAAAVAQALHRPGARQPNVTTVSIGKTHSGNNILVYSLQTNSQNATLSPIHIFLFGGMHAREWITVAATLCLLVAKLTSFDEKGVVLHVLPLLNPDGYDYSRTSPQRRHWRKNLNGLGVDLNRNFGVENVSWGFGNPHNQHSELYQGPRPFSERESQVLRRFVASLPKRSIVLDVHCCARVVFPPLNLDSAHQILPVTEDIRRIGQGIARSMNTVLPKGITKRYALRSRETAFSSSNTGVAIDWIYSLPNIDYAFMIEVRGKRFPNNFRDLFNNARTDIVPVAREIEAALRFIMELSPKPKDSSRSVSHRTIVRTKQADLPKVNLRPPLTSGRLSERLAEYETLARASLYINCLGLTAIVVLQNIAPL